jgi:H+-translocating NAD(P) transhydrogenase subunit beta
MMGNAVQLAYLGASTLFIVGLKGLSHPRTAVRGNLLGALGMLIAICAVCLERSVVGFGGVAAGLLAGGAVGALVASRVRMTGMPQLVALFNGVGGLASALVACAQVVGTSAPLGGAARVAVALAALVGTVTFTGSLLALAKLKGWTLDLRGRWITPLNVALLLGAAGLAATAAATGEVRALWLLVGLAGLLGVTLVAPIGGADMPVVIALLNSYSGLAAGAAGFALHNTALVVCGSLVGASGLILTAIMCKAMNRSLAQVIFGGRAIARTADAGDVYASGVKQTSPDEVALLLHGARRVVVVPGYGMAVAQAQHAVRDLARALERRGARVEYAIHPVAGRMPGHMNVLLAEADVPYEQLIEMEAINPSFPDVDVALVVGANDIVNPSARDQPGSPIAGMPILEVDRARTVVIIKRSLSPGFAGVPNPLFVADNALMLLSEARAAISEVTRALDDAG